MRLALALLVTLSIGSVGSAVLADEPTPSTCTVGITPYEDDSFATNHPVIVDGLTVAESWVVDDYRRAGTITIAADGTRVLHTAWTPAWHDVPCAITVPTS